MLAIILFAALLPCAAARADLPLAPAYPSVSLKGPQDAKGAVIGDGVALVVFKRLEDALADGDHIYAVIKGSAVNNDGSLKVGYTARYALKDDLMEYICAENNQDTTHITTPTP